MPRKQRFRRPRRTQTRLWWARASLSRIVARNNSKARLRWKRGSARESGTGRAGRTTAEHPSVGQVLALTWALEIGEVERLGSIVQATSYCGLTVSFCARQTRPCLKSDSKSAIRAQAISRRYFGARLASLPATTAAGLDRRDPFQLCARLQQAGQTPSVPSTRRLSMTAVTDGGSIYGPHIEWRKEFGRESNSLSCRTR